MELFNKQRGMNLSVDMDQLHIKILNEKINKDSSFKSVYSNMVNISKEWSYQAPEYVHSPYQCYVAANTILNMEKHRLIELPQG